MFKKLVANLPFNPGLIHQIGFYADRLRAENSIRRMSFALMALVVGLQSFAVIAPPEASYASGNSHIMSNVTTKAQILNTYDSNIDIRAIFDHFGITRADLANMTSTSTGGPDQVVNPFDGRQWRTIGRESLTTRSGIDPAYINDEKTISYPRSDGSTGTVYERDLKVWNDHHWEAFKGVNSATGQEFWILKDCGNLAWVNEWRTPPKPTISAACSIIGPLVIEHDAATVNVPVRIHLPAGASVGPGSVTGTQKNGGTGIHLGVTAAGANRNWNVDDANVLATEPLVPPDKQTDYQPLRSDIRGVEYYEFKWAYDNQTYRRYFVTDAHSSDFTVTLNVQVNKNDKWLAVRILDRDRGAWLPHNTACQIPVQRKDVPPPPPPAPTPIEPALEIRKSTNARSTLKPGESYTYKIEYRNKIINSIAKDVYIRDQLDFKNYTLVSPKNLNISPSGYLNHKVGDLRGSSTFHVLEITVRLKDPLESGLRICNVASIESSNAAKLLSSRNSACVTVLRPCPYDSDIGDINNPDCRTPEVVCELLDTAINYTTRVVDFKTVTTSSNERITKIHKYDYDFGDDQTQTNSSSAFTDTTQHRYEPGDYVAHVVVTYEVNGVEGLTETEDCPVDISFEADQPLGQIKRVANITKDLKGENALNSQVSAGDVLEYTLITVNSQNYERTGVLVKDYIGDVLDYATLDETALAKSGGRYDKNSKEVIWENLTIPASSQVESIFRVQLLNPIPATNRPPAADGDFDCKISNTYGNKTEIGVQCPLVKGIETIPNTGPGTSMLGVVFITTVTGYFFARARLLKKELQLIRSDYAVTGGM